ncbi:uracil nucleotide/cysteinyl leukotriene receptor-like [Salmo trutta]|uniref:uracil nucleotide/cysteinyl leukotriene receptor-like n=1 Tax=Salmo trutta TaxID=8032 RepID=UPI0011328000|nr:uracil nucleotide/cysteinyl leukotriene receptor-like [Salmo trutta]
MLQMHARSHNAWTSVLSYQLTPSYDIEIGCLMKRHKTKWMQCDVCNVVGLERHRCFEGVKTAEEERQINLCEYISKSKSNRTTLTSVEDLLPQQRAYWLRDNRIMMNYTEEARHGFYTKGSHHENILFASFYILVFLVAVPGNILALWVFCRQADTSPSKLFLKHLAIADVSYVLILPMRMVYHFSDSRWPFGEVPCRLVGFLFYLNMYCSLYFMTCISLDRLLALVLPLKSRSMRKASYARVVVVILWVIVTVSTAPMLFSKKQTMILVDNTTVVMCNQLYLEKTSPKALVSTMVAFIIPLVTIVVSYILILLKLRGIKQQEGNPIRDKAIGMIILIMVNFLVAFVPYHLNRFIYIERHTHSDMETVSIEALALANRVTSALTCLSGALDPIMYFFLARTYQSILLQLFCKDRRSDQPTTT